MSDGPPSPGPWGEAAGALVHPTPEEPDGLQIDFVGRRGALFWLALKTGFLSVLTFGIYRFWMKTRLRRWYWSAIRPGGVPLEYTGDPIEKLLGFFIAVVILTFYIGIVNLLLMFASFTLFNAPSVGYLASFAGVVPLWFYARYRARRYVLARTRWRGVRFGLEPGAWGYAARALIHWTITILTLGLLWPRMTFALEKYRTDRTFFGSARLTQGGRWPMLYRAAIPFVLGLLVLLGAGLWTWQGEPELLDRLQAGGLSDLGAETTFDEGQLFTTIRAPEALLLFPLGFAGLLFGAIYYRWVSKRIMAQHKQARGIRLHSTLSGVRVAFIYVLGNFIAYLFLIVGVVALVLLALGLFGVEVFYLGEVGAGALSDLPRWLSFALLGVLYLGVFLLWGVLHNTFVTFPLMRHMARTTSLSETGGLHLISQRERDAFAEAEGFAEALDLGAAI
ncbi:MAG: DUF898 family protein [Sulfitobacter sp.]|nr:DUF898 family protein [Sulfitobacter sp.]